MLAEVLLQFGSDQNLWAWNQPNAGNALLIRNPSQPAKRQEHWQGDRTQWYIYIYKYILILFIYYNTILIRPLAWKATWLSLRHLGTGSEQSSFKHLSERLCLSTKTMEMGRVRNEANKMLHALPNAQARTFGQPCLALAQLSLQNVKQVAYIFRKVTLNLSHWYHEHLND